MTDNVSAGSEQRGLAWCFAVAIFVSAFLVFQVQPVISKVILPWFGGSPAVWTSCMLFFQTALFAGYAYAHWSVSRLTPRWQGAIHLLLIALALSVLPLSPAAEWKPFDGSWPTLRILGILATSVGLPYFLLASSGPLLQAWFGQSFSSRSPYRLYALSNTASMLGLLTYPFIFEPAFTTAGQGQFWTFVFLVFALLSAWLAWRLFARVCEPTDLMLGNATAKSAELPSVGQRIGWLALAAYGSAMLLATTNHVCQDVAVMPLLWVLPLSLYLLSFIICFDNPRWYSRYWCGRGLVVATFLAAIVSRVGATIPVIVEVGVFFVLLLLACMVCHGELVRRRPEKNHLTMFYQYCAAGGAVGGILVSLICPQLFNGFLEMSVGLLVAYLLGLYVAAKSETTAGADLLQRRKAAPFVFGYLGLLAIAWGQFGGASGTAIAATRNFYGVLTVHEREVIEDGQPMGRIREILHGRILHGTQWLDDELRRVPTTYYAEETAIGQLLRKAGKEGPIRVGVIGLGGGTLAAYGREGDYYRFYEINPDVIEIAREYFSYLSDLPSKSDMVLGDARISLEREAPQAFDVLALDAFSGDAVPAHLITVEAMKIYLGHLNEHGVLAIHISNRHIDLLPVVSGLCRHLGLQCRHVPTRMDLGTGSGTCEWAVVSRKAGLIEKLVANQQVARSFGPEEELPLWTDNFSNIIGSLRKAND